MQVTRDSIVSRYVCLMFLDNIIDCSNRKVPINDSIETKELKFDKTPNWDGEYKRDSIGVVNNNIKLEIVVPERTITIDLNKFLFKIFFNID